MKIQKLKKYIEKAYEIATSKGKFPKGIPSLYVFQELVRVYNGIISGKTVDFICGDIAPILDRCGIKYREEGIGWIIEPEKVA